MIEFENTIERKITLKSSDRGLPSVEWVLTLGPEGLGMRRLGESDEMFLSWRSIIGHALIHRAGRKP